MSNIVKIAGVQLAGTPDTDRNLRRASEMIAAAAARDARLVILPELWAYPWFTAHVNEAARELAEPITGALVGAMRDVARAHGLQLIVPFFERDSAADTSFNAAVLVNEQGELAGHYRKIHVPQLPGWEERFYFAPGDRGFPVFDSVAGKLGVQLGWDLLFPEGLRLLALAGAEVVAAPMAVSDANDDLWQRVVMTGAFVNGLWICRVGRVGRENGVVFAGQSFCATPTGDMLDEPAADSESVTLWEIDRRAVPLVRRDWPLLNERRPDQYGPLARAAGAGEGQTR